MIAINSRTSRKRLGSKRIVTNVNQYVNREDVIEPSGFIVFDPENFFEIVCQNDVEIEITKGDETNTLNISSYLAMSISDPVSLKIKNASADNIRIRTTYS